jgi:protein dithiol:quinone oxidoreductase
MSRLLNGSPRCFLLIIVLGLGSLALALLTQHALDMQPCPWCVLQRMIMVLIALIAVMGLLWRHRMVWRISGSVVVALSLSGVAAALWQHWVANQSASCKLTLADRIVSGSGLDALAPEVFAARASCADAITTLLGVPYEFWSLAMFVLLGALAVQAVRLASAPQRMFT